MYGGFTNTSHVVTGGGTSHFPPLVARAIIYRIILPLGFFEEFFRAFQLTPRTTLSPFPDRNLRTLRDPKKALVKKRTYGYRSLVTGRNFYCINRLRKKSGL